MDAAIVLDGRSSPAQARELISAARDAGAKKIRAWCFGEAAPLYRALPLDAVHHRETRGPLAGNQMLPALEGLEREHRPRLILFCGTSAGDELAVLLGQRMGAFAATGVSGLEPRKEGLRIRRYVYGMQLEGCFEVPCGPWVCSVLRDHFPPSPGDGTPEMIPDGAWREPATLWDTYREWTEGPADALGGSRTVLVGGQGVGGAAAMNALRELGELLEAGVGATRPVVQKGWAPMGSLLGVSGTVVRPEVCLVFGASGCPAFLKGVDRSRTLIAVNSDPDAPIFRHCDAGLVADAPDTIRALLRRTRQERTERS